VSTPLEGGRGLRVGLFGFPVHVDLSFVLIMGLIGWMSQVRGPRDLTVWIVVATASILVHELGHAVVARTTGARPAIALSGFGGLTTYVPPRPLSRARSLSISLAGPASGLAAGGAVWWLRQALGEQLEGGSLLERATAYGVFTTIAWSVLNLVPVLPLDGGQAMRELLPGDAATRTRRAAMVSLGVLVPLLGLSVWANQVWTATFLVLFGFSNVQILRAGSPQRAAAGPGSGPAAVGPQVTPEQAVVGLLWQGSPAAARELLGTLPPGTVTDLAVHGAVLVATGDTGQGEALLAQEAARRPGDANVAALVVLAHALHRDWPALEADLTGPLGPRVPLGVVDRVVQEARTAGRPDVADRILALPLRGPEPR